MYRIGELDAYDHTEVRANFNMLPDVAEAVFLYLNPLFSSLRTRIDRTGDNTNFDNLR